MRGAMLALLLAASGTAVPVKAQLAEGAAIFNRADKGHCSACHDTGEIPEGAPRDVGPALGAARMRELGRPALLALLEDPMRANPATVMPPYGRHGILDEREISLVVDYLLALPMAPSQPDAADKPSVASDAEAAGAEAVLAAGKAIWTRKFRNGRSLAGCFPNGGRRIAGSYPHYDSRLKRVVTLETAVNQCRKAHGEALLDADDPATMGAVIAYVRSLSAGQKMAVRVPPAAQPRLDEGRRLYHTRMGQRNYACASCHVQSAGKRYAGIALSAAAEQAPRAPVIRSGRAITLQMRFRECLERMGAAPFPAGSEELNHLEYFLAHAANGQPLRPSGVVPR